MRSAGVKIEEDETAPYVELQQRIQKLEESLPELSRQFEELEEWRRRGESADVLARENEALKTEMAEMKKEGKIKNDEMNYLLNQRDRERQKACDMQTKDRARIDDLMQKLAQFEKVQKVSSISSPSSEFDILGLPSELLSNIFSFLTIKDRLRFAGVNKRLNFIEKESKYFVEDLKINEISILADEEEEVDCFSPHQQRMTFYKEKSYSSDCIKRIAHNLSIGCLQIECREYEMLKEMMDDSFLFDLTRSCTCIELDYGLCEKITPEAIHQVYKDMIKCSTKLREFAVGLCEESSQSFLNLIGITHTNGKVYSNRGDIEGYKKTSGRFVCFYAMFDGFLEIHIDVDMTRIRLEFHETQESLENAKNRKDLVRIDITPE